MATLTQPVVSWRLKSDRTNAITTYDFLTVPANTESAPMAVEIWNNYGSTTDDAPDMTECTVTTRDATSGITGPVVTEKWVQVCVLSAGDNPAKLATDPTPGWHAIGGVEAQELIVGSGIMGHEHAIKAAGQTDNRIKGTHNTGASTDTTNFADLQFKVAVPLNALAGTSQFKMRTDFKYT